VVPLVCQPLAEDTSLESEAVLEGIRRRHPNAGPREQFLRLALLRLGPELTVEAFPEAAALVG
jgi:hypothetical protein